jgi:hypothetical protein
MFSMGEKQTQKIIAEGEYSELAVSDPFGPDKRLIFERDKNSFWNSVLIYRVWAPHEDGYAVYDYNFTETAMLSAKFFIALVFIIFRAR